MNVLTIDIEEWFHILDHDSTKSETRWSSCEYRLEANAARILEVLERKNQAATFFVLGWAARKYPRLVRELDRLGYEVGTHSDGHQLAYEQTAAEFRDDLDRSIKSIQDCIGKKVKSYRAPGFSVVEGNTWVFDELIRQGIEVDCSVCPAVRSHGGFAGFGHAEPVIIDRRGGELREFPINVHPVLGQRLMFSGGGYFRLWPYWMIRRMMRKSDYVMAYFHPRDFDPGQPMIEDLSLVRRFKSYYGLASSLKKLERLIDDFEFVDLASACRSVDWARTKRIAL